VAEMTATDSSTRAPLWQGARVLVPANPGCILHLRGAADAAHAPFDVRHFVEPVADRSRQLVPVRREARIRPLQGRIPLRSIQRYQRTTGRMSFRDEGKR